MQTDRDCEEPSACFIWLTPDLKALLLTGWCRPSRKLIPGSSTPTPWRTQILPALVGAAASALGAIAFCWPGSSAHSA
jgi:hypothetical protein